jgi:hypothetical protein
MPRGLSRSKPRHTRDGYVEASQVGFTSGERGKGTIAFTTPFELVQLDDQITASLGKR